LNSTNANLGPRISGVLSQEFCSGQCTATYVVAASLSAVQTNDESPKG
jgi:hypothetical protein